MSAVWSLSGGAGFAQEAAATTAASPAPAPEATAAATKTGAAGKAGKEVSAKGDNSSAGPFGDLSNGNRGPVNIQADSLSLDYKNNSVVFTGHVRAKQAGGELTSDSLDVKYGKDFHEIQNATADHDVRMSQGVQWCTSDHAVLNQVVHTVVLTGDPVCHNANDQVSGPKITVHLDTGKSDVEGGVKAMLFPHDSKNRDNGTLGTTGTDGTTGATVDPGK
jgi:lipopolysaccharide transport protein LptA